MTDAAGRRVIVAKVRFFPLWCRCLVQVSSELGRRYHILGRCRDHPRAKSHGDRKGRARRRPHLRRSRPSSPSRVCSPPSPSSSSSSSAREDPRARRRRTASTWSPPRFSLSLYVCSRRRSCYRPIEEEHRENSRGLSAERLHANGRKRGRAIQACVCSQQSRFPFWHPVPGLQSMCLGVTRSSDCSLTPTG